MHSFKISVKMFASKLSFLKTIVLFACLLEKSSGTCVNKFALSSVHALVRSEPNTRLTLEENANFNSLDRFTSIDVLASNVSQLCTGMVKDFPVLKSLTMINLELSEIQPGTFQAVPQLEELSFAVNQLVYVARGVFDPVKSLKVIHLTGNRIRSIEDGAFALMPLLKKVYLAHNQIAQLTGNIFFGSPRLSLVDFSFNKLTTVENNSFDDLRIKEGSPKEPTEILLQRNDIETVAPEAFLDLRPVLLHLEHNQLSRISQLITALPDGSKVFLNGNRVQCIPDDVLERLRDENVHLWVRENPLTCECLERAQSVLDSGIKGQLNVSTTLPCNLLPTFF